MAKEWKHTQAFGDSTVMRGLDGRYLSSHSLQVQDRVHRIYTDTTFVVEEQFERSSRDAEPLREASFEAAVAQSQVERATGEDRKRVEPVPIVDFLLL